MEGLWHPTKARLGSRARLHSTHGVDACEPTARASGCSTCSGVGRRSPVGLMLSSRLPPWCVPLHGPGGTWGADLWSGVARAAAPAVVEFCGDRDPPPGFPETQCLLVFPGRPAQGAASICCPSDEGALTEVDRSAGARRGGGPVREGFRRYTHRGSTHAVADGGTRRQVAKDGIEDEAERFDRGRAPGRGPLCLPEHDRRCATRSRVEEQGTPRRVRSRTRAPDRTSAGSAAGFRVVTERHEERVDSTVIDDQLDCVASIRSSRVGSLQRQCGQARRAEVDLLTPSVK